MGGVSIQPILQDPAAKRLDRNRTHFSKMIEMAGGAGSSNGTGGMLTKTQGTATLADRVRRLLSIFIDLSSLMPFDEAWLEQADGSYFLAEDKGLKTQKPMTSLLCRESKVPFGWMLEQRKKPCWIMERVY